MENLNWRLNKEFDYIDSVNSFVVSSNGVSNCVDEYIDGVNCCIIVCSCL